MIKELANKLQNAINSSQRDESMDLLKILCSKNPEMVILTKTSILPILSTQTKCQICSQFFRVADLITLDCDHRFCPQDLKKDLFSKIESLYFSPNDIICSVCHKPISFHVIQNLVPKNLFEKYDKALLKSYIDDQPKPPIELSQFKCEVCTKEIEENQRRILECDHKFCESCLNHQFLKKMEDDKNITRDSMLCQICKKIIVSDIVLDVLPKKDQEIYSNLLNKKFLEKKQVIQLPAIFIEEQIKEIEVYIDKLHKKFDFKIQGDLKERAQITLIFFEETVHKKLNKKLKIFEKLNDAKMKQDLPKDWGIFNEPVRVVPLAVEDPKYVLVSTEFKKTAQNQIISISEIQNKSLYKKYNMIVKEVIDLKRKNNPNINIDGFERYLWHGTRQNDPALIYNDEIYGFDLRHANVGGAYGRGLYFGTTAQISMGYLGFKNTQGNNIFLYNKVFVGESCVGKAGLLQAPLKPGSKEFYDSTSNGSMIVIYDCWRAYPNYIIEFK